MAEDGWGRQAEDLALDVRRVSDRLRSLSQTRLGRPCPPYPSAADAGRRAAAVLADAARELEAAAPGPANGPADRAGRHDVPRLSDFAVGDQVAVTGNDLLAALDLVPPDADVDGRTARDAVAEAAAVLTDVRQRL